MLVITLGHQSDGPHQRGVLPPHRLLQIEGQGQVGAPVGMLQPAVVRAHQQHGLAGHDAALLRHGLVDDALAAQRVPVHVDHHRDVRKLRQVFLHRRAGAGVGAGVAGKVVDLPVVQHAQPGLFQQRRQFIPHAYDVALGVRCAIAVVGLVAVQPCLGVSLAAVGVQDQDLRSLGGQPDRRALQQHTARVHRIACLILDAQPSLDCGLPDLIAARALHQIHAALRLRDRGRLRRRTQRGRREREKRGRLRHLRGGALPGVRYQHHVFHPAIFDPLPQQGQSAVCHQHIHPQNQNAHQRQSFGCPHSTAPLHPILYAHRGREYARPGKARRKGASQNPEHIFTI